MPRPRKPKPEPALGQVWKSRLKRGGGRKMRVVGSAGPGRWLMQNIETGRNALASTHTLHRLYKLLPEDGFYDPSE